MRNNGFIIPIVIAIVSVVSGYGIGRWHITSGKKNSENVSLQYSDSGKPMPIGDSGRVKPVRRRGSSSAKEAESSGDKSELSFDESFAMKLQHLGRRGSHAFWMMSARESLEWMQLFSQIEPGDVRKWLAYVEDNMPGPAKQYLSRVLLEKLAETDLKSAFSYAEGLPKLRSRQQALVVVASTWARSDRLGAINWANSIANERFREEVMNSLITVIGASNPEAGLDLAEAEGLFNSQTWGWTYTEIFANFAAVDPQAAVDRAMTLTNVDQRFGALREIMQTWSSQDPQGALKWLETFQSGNKDQLVSTVFRNWAEKDFDSAFLYVTQISDIKTKNNLLYTLGEELAQEDPNAAIALANSMPDGLRRTQLLGDIVRGWIERSPEEALKYIEGLPAGIEKNKILNAVVGRLSYSDPWSAMELAEKIPNGIYRMAGEITGGLIRKEGSQVALDWIDTLPDGSAKWRALQSIGWQLARNDPEVSVAYVDKISPGTARDNFIRNIASSWAQQDAFAAADWLMTLADGKAKQDAFNSINWQMANQNPEMALEYAEAMGKGDTQNNLLQRIAQNMVESDISQAEEWFRQLPGGDLKDHAMQGIVNGMMRSDPYRAAVFISEQPAGDAQSRLAVSVAGQWAQDDPDAAAEWAGSFTGDVRKQAISSVVSHWSRQDPLAAGEWVYSLPHDDSRENALQNYVSSTTWQYPEYAAAYATAIEDEKTRHNSIKNVANNWLRSDPDGTAAWLKRTDLPEEGKKEILDRIAKQK